MLKCIIDCDPGIDDALALILASKFSDIEIKAITTVFGNTSVEYTSSNALRVLELIKRSDIPVAKGRSEPLVKYLRFQPFKFEDEDMNPHGKNGLGNTNLPEPKLALSNLHAIELMEKILLRNPNEIMIITLGPLTNLALLFLKNPDIVKNIKKIYIMGGAIRVSGNVTPYSEFNIWSDAEAAQIVFYHAYDKITLVPLDITRKVVITDFEIFNKNDKYNKFIYEILSYYSIFHKKKLGFYGSQLHDPFTLGLALSIAKCRIEKIPIYVEIDDMTKYGKIHTGYKNMRLSREIDVCLEITKNEINDFIETFIDIIRK